MSIHHFIAILQARWRSALLAFAVALLAVATVTLLQPRRYTATASVVLDVKSPDPVSGMVLQGLTSPSYMLTQVDVLQSLRVAAHVARDLGLLEKPEWRQEWLKATGGQGSMEAWVAEGLRDALDARPSRGSNVINVTFTSRDPAFAALAANAFVKSYVDTALELRVEPAREYSRFFDSQAKQLRANLEAAQAKLSSYQQSHGIIATDDRLDVETTRLNELSSQLVALQAVASESGSRQQQVSANADRMPEVAGNPIVAALRADVLRMEARLDELSDRLGDQHPQVKELRANISRLQDSIKAETRRASGGVAVNNNVNQTRLAQLRASVDQQHAKVLQMKGLRDQAAVLLQDVGNAQRAYDGVQARLNQTSLEGKTAQANVATLELAAEPTAPSSPRVRTNVILGLILGIVVAVATIVLREFRDRRLRTNEEMTALVNHPLIAVVPAFGNKNRAVPFSVKRLALGSRHATGHSSA